LVVKTPYIWNVVQPPQELICPTVRIARDNEEDIFIQPLLNLTPSQKACDLLEKELDTDFIGDIKPDNCGWYNNRPVILDW
jgi:hypothetical protein